MAVGGGGDGVRDDGRNVPDDRSDMVLNSDGFRDGEAVPGFLPWIMALADPDESGLKGRRRNPKRLGELSQAAFLAKAQSLGFGLALPWGDSEKYDFVVWARPEGELLRVQVKATGRLNGGGYDVQPVYSTRGEREEDLYGAGY
jgi:PD-(D/E)XK endonuclease